jgi:Ca2+-binding RTX toxin-like protein
VARRLAATRKRGHRRRPHLAFLAATLAAALWPASALAAPANDDFANAQVITGLTGSVSSTNVDATKEIGEPDHAGNPGGHSIWYSWTAPADGNVAFTTLGSAFDTLLAVYTGAAVGALTPVAANDDDPGAGGVSTVSFAVSNGVTYKVAVDGFSGKVGLVNLRWHPSPANDNFADVQVLPSTSSGTATGETRGATLEPGEPAQLLFNPGTIWYSWTAPADGTYKFDTFGSNFDTVLAVYAGSSLDALDLVRINDDDPDRGCCSSWVPIANTTSGTTYSIAVLPFEDSTGGHVVLRWSPLILGGSASETLLGTAGDDEIRGRGGNDVVRGFGGRDAIFGGAGRDAMFGGPGRDLEYGGAGSDSLFDHRGVDRLFGGEGNDRLNARDSHPSDLVAGGSGVDTCRADRGDTRRRCP